MAAIDIVTVSNWSLGYRPTKARISFVGETSPAPVEVSLFDGPDRLTANEIGYGDLGLNTIQRTLTIDNIDFSFGNDLVYLRAIVPDGWSITNIEFYNILPMFDVDIVSKIDWSNRIIKKMSITISDVGSPHEGLPGDVSIILYDGLNPLTATVLGSFIGSDLSWGVFDLDVSNFTNVTNLYLKISTIEGWKVTEIKILEADVI